MASSLKYYPKSLGSYKKMETNKKELKGRRVKVNYNALADEVARDEGLVYDITSDFLVLDIGEKLKWISLNKIIRVEEL